MDPEGGNIFLEHITFDADLQRVFQLPDGQTTVIRVMAYFMSAQTPDSNPLPAQGTCTNLDSTKSWPMYVGSPHTDVDVGTLTVVGKNADGQDKTVAIPRGTVNRDLLGRPHDVFYQFFQANAPALLAPDSSYDVKFSGSTSVPATTFSGAIYLAASYGLPLHAPDFDNNGPLMPGHDFIVTWTVGAPANKPTADRLVSGDVLGVVWLSDVLGSPTHLCVAPAGASQFTIPGSTIAEYKQVAMARGRDLMRVILVRSAMVHQVVTLPLTAAPNARRRIDMIGLKSYAQRMDVQ